MLGFSYGEIFLLIGATIAIVGPKDIPRIARTAGILAGRSIGCVQLARGQFDNVMQQSQAREVHKELQDTMAQLEAIRYEIRSISLVNPGPMTRNFMDNALGNQIPRADSGNVGFEKEKPDDEELKKRIETILKDHSFRASEPNVLNEKKNRIDTILQGNSFGASESIDLHAQATSYEKLAKEEALKSASFKENVEKLKLDDEFGLFAVLPVSAESANLLPDRKENASGSDIMLEAVLEAEVAHNAKNFFAQAHNHIPEK